MRSEVKMVMENLESVDGMEARILQELVKKEDKRKKEARLARKLEMESLWLARRKEEDAQEVVDVSKGSFMMEWEEHDLEYKMASLGLEEEDLFNEEEIGEDEQDWLDTWRQHRMGGRGRGDEDRPLGGKGL